MSEEARPRPGFGLGLGAAGICLLGSWACGLGFMAVLIPVADSECGMWAARGCAMFTLLDEALAVAALSLLLAAAFLLARVVLAPRLRARLTGPQTAWWSLLAAACALSVLVLVALFVKMLGG